MTQNIGMTGQVLNAVNGVIAAEQEKSHVAMNAACGTEFAPPRDMTSAAAAIKRLRQERDSAKQAVAQELTELRTEAAYLTKEIADFNSGKVAQDGSPLVSAQNRLLSALHERDAAVAELVAVRAGIRDTLVDLGMAQIPNIAGYCSGDTPLLRAAESAATFVHGDQASREKLLRRRGWRLSENSAWLAPGEDKASIPLDVAVMRVFKEDTARFKPLASWNEFADGPIQSFPAVEAIPAETRVLAMTTPIQTTKRNFIPPPPAIVPVAPKSAFIRPKVNVPNNKYRNGGRSDETFVMPSLR